MTSYAFGLLTVRISVLRVIFDVIVVVNKHAMMVKERHLKFNKNCTYED